LEPEYLAKMIWSVVINSAGTHVCGRGCSLACLNAVLEYFELLLYAPNIGRCFCSALNYVFRLVWLIRFKVTLGEILCGLCCVTVLVLMYLFIFFSSFWIGRCERHRRSCVLFSPDWLKIVHEGNVF
jgi:hypothetical protein